MAMDRNERPGVRVSTVASSHTQVYILPKSKQQWQQLKEQIDHESVTILDPASFDSHAARKPSDGEMLIDLREDEKEETFHCNPSWWSCVYNQ